MTSPIDHDLRARARELRELLMQFGGLSQEEMADRMEVSLMSVRRIEADSAPQLSVRMFRKYLGTLEDAAVAVGGSVGPRIAAQAKHLAAELELSLTRQSKVRVLILDDDEAFLHAVERSLVRQHVSVYAFASPVEALLQIPIIRPSIALVDYRMPLVNGLEMYHHIRRIPVLNSMDVVFVSGIRDPVLEAAAKTFGVEVVEKPLLMAVISTIIERYL